jgi:lysozyme family protein
MKENVMKKSKGFTTSIAGYVLASEGGYVNHPRDPGKATNMGITIRTLAAWRGTNVSNDDVRNLTRKEALEIYKAQYWVTVSGDNLPLGIDYLTFDYGVNSGPARAIKDLQRTVGVTADGVIGQITMAAIQDYVDATSVEALIEAYANRRWNFVQSLSTFRTFGNGWKRRIWGSTEGMQAEDSGAADRALKLSQERYTEIFNPTVATPGKAEPEKPGLVDMIKDPATLTGMAGAVATVSGAVQDQPVLQVGAVLGIFGVVFFYLKSKRKEDPS